MRRRAHLLLPIALAVVLVAPGSSISAQTLDRVDALARQGQVGEARQWLTRWWETESAGASRSDAQRGLWLRALLTPDARQASIDYRRLTVEYPGGEYSSEALFRLVQEAASREDWDAALAHVAVLERDYPASPRGGQARAWLATRRAPATSRGAEPITAQTSTVPSAATRTSEPTGARGTLAIQIGAFGSLAGARAMVDRARDSGLDARLVRVPGSDLYRVRSGAFDDPDEVAAHRARALSLGFQAMLVSDVAQESAIP